MRAQVVSATGVSTSPTIGLDVHQSPFAVGFGAVVSGTVTYTIQHTFDEIFNIVDPRYVAASSATWFDHATVAAQTASKDSNYAFPVKAIRINITAGTGSVVLTAIQAGGVR